MSKGMGYRVTPGKGGWMVKRGTASAIAIYPDRETAITKAIELARAVKQPKITVYVKTGVGRYRIQSKTSRASRITSVSNTDPPPRRPPHKK